MISASRLKRDRVDDVLCGRGGELIAAKISSGDGMGDLRSQRERQLLSTVQPPSPLALQNTRFHQVQSVPVGELKDGETYASRTAYRSMFQ